MGVDSAGTRRGSWVILPRTSELRDDNPGAEASRRSSVSQFFLNLPEFLSHPGLTGLSLRFFTLATHRRDPPLTSGITIGPDHLSYVSLIPSDNPLNPIFFSRRLPFSFFFDVFPFGASLFSSSRSGEAGEGSWPRRRLALAALTTVGVAAE